MMLCGKGSNNRFYNQIENLGVNQLHCGLPTHIHYSYRHDSFSKLFYCVAPYAHDPLHHTRIYPQTLPTLAQLCFQKILQPFLPPPPNSILAPFHFLSTTRGYINKQAGGLALRLSACSSRGLSTKWKHLHARFILALISANVKGYSPPGGSRTHDRRLSMKVLFPAELLGGKQILTLPHYLSTLLSKGRIGVYNKSKLRCYNE